MVVKPKVNSTYYAGLVTADDLDVSVISMMGTTPATNTFYVSPAFTGKANPYFTDLETAVIAANATSKTIIVYTGAYSLNPANSSITGLASAPLNIKCFGNVAFNVADMYYISYATIDGAYFNLAGQVNIANSKILDCDSNLGNINCNGGNVRFDCPKTSAWNVFINNSCKVTGRIENLNTLTVTSGTAYLNIIDNTGLLTVQSSGTGKIKAKTATNIVNYGSFSGEIATLALGSNSITNFGILKLSHCVITNNAYYAIYGGSASKTILKSSTINSSSNGYGVNSSGEVLLRNCVFTGKSISGHSVLAATLNAFDVCANGAVIGTYQTASALYANILTNLIIDVL